MIKSQISQLITVESIWALEQSWKGMRYETTKKIMAVSSCWCVLTARKPPLWFNTLEAVDQLFPFCQNLKYLGILPHVYTNARWPFPGGLWEEILQVNPILHGLGGIRSYPMNMLSTLLTFIKVSLKPATKKQLLCQPPTHTAHSDFPPEGWLCSAR